MYISTVNTADDWLQKSKRIFECKLNKQDWKAVWLLDLKINEMSV